MWQLRKKQFAKSCFGERDRGNGNEDRGVKSRGERSSRGQGAHSVRGD